MKNEVFDFYDKTSLKSYNLDHSMQYQLNMLDRLDVYTRKHSENVANIVCRICKYLHCTKSFVEYCTICAYLHDIGKLFIPPEVLQKPDKLSDEEYEMMKKHTTIGHQMCMKDLKLRRYAAGPLYHHEALDGTGYPNGLQKKEIPYEGQIIRVADEYDAIVSKRQYKTHVGISDTLKFLANNSKPDSSCKDKNSPRHQYGKNNPTIVKALFKVVVDDIIYEITTIESYVVYLKQELKRFKQLDEYYKAMEKAKKEKDKNYYLEGMKVLFRKHETVDNYKELWEEYKFAYESRKSVIEHLYQEMAIIKKIKVN